MSDSEARFNRHLQQQENEHLDAMYAQRSAGETTMSEPLTEAEIAEIEQWAYTLSLGGSALTVERITALIDTIRSLQAENERCHEHVTACGQQIDGANDALLALRAENARLVALLREAVERLKRANSNHRKLAEFVAALADHEEKNE